MTFSQFPLWLPLFQEPFSNLEISKPRTVYREILEQLVKAPELLGGPVLDKQMACCCMGALWLKADYFDQAHGLFQDVHTPTGSLWHGISHRREGDHGNASYWFARCPNHPAGKEIRFVQIEKKQPNSRIINGEWNYDTFNRLVENQGTNGRSKEELIQLQDTEWRKTFLWTLKKALGTNPIQS